MSGELRLPLFPLPLVLFPGAPLTLNVFEPRYRRMVAQCVAQHLSFAVVLVQHSAAHSADLVAIQQMREYLARFPDADDEYPNYLPHLIATEVRIDTCVQRDDGCYTIECHGARRIQITGLHQRAPFLVAQAQVLNDVSTAASKAAAFALRQMYARYWHAIQRTSQHKVSIPALPDGDIELSWHLAHAMQVEDERKQYWLEMSVVQRLRSMIGPLRAERNSLPLQVPTTPFQRPWSWN